MTNRMVRVAGPDLRNMRSHAEGCVDETPGPETGRVLSGTNGRYSSPRGASMMTPLFSRGQRGPEASLIVADLTEV